MVRRISFVDYKKSRQMIISAIVAKAQNDIIGKDNDLPWRLSNDLKWFKSKTLNRHIIMGTQVIRMSS